MRILILCIWTSLCFGQKPEVPIVNFERLDNMIQKKDDTTYVFNFWATWCKPCVEEMPDFEALQAKYKQEKLKVVLVSLDFDSHLETRLIPYLKKNKIKSFVVLLDEPDANLWIDRVSVKWNGTIPATLIVNNKNKHRSFYEGTLNLAKLEEIVKPIIVL